MKQFNARMDAASRKYVRDRAANLLDARAAAASDKGFDSHFRKLTTPKQ